MIALTPQSRKRARFDFARNEFSQKSGKTNAPTIGLDAKFPLLDRLPERSSPLLAKWDDYHKVALRAEKRKRDDRSWSNPRLPPKTAFYASRPFMGPILRGSKGRKATLPCAPREGPESASEPHSNAE